MKAEMAEESEATLQRSQSTPEPIFDPKSVKEVTLGKTIEVVIFLEIW